VSAPAHTAIRGFLARSRTRLLLSFDTANRDPERFEDADVFVVDRPDAHAHLTFGWGPHVCLGAGLARVELQESLRALVARFGPPRLADGIDPVGSFTVPDELRIHLEPRR